jgi:hypothetical protein
VLNLWQKNNVFAPEVIQPLFDLANPDHPVHQAFMQQQPSGQVDMSNGMKRDSPTQKEEGAPETVSDKFFIFFMFSNFLQRVCFSSLIMFS